MTLEERLVQLFCDMPNLQTTRDRQHFAYLDPEVFAQINLNGSSHEFSNGLVTYLASKGVTKLTSFLQKLADYELFSLEHRAIFQDFVGSIKSLSDKQWNIEFPSITASQAITRRQLLSNLLVGLGAVGGLGQLPNLLPSETRTKILLRWDRFIDPKPIEDFNTRDLMLLFGSDPSQCGVFPGDSNKHLVAQGKFRTPSKYVQLAFDNSNAALKGVLGVEHTQPVPYTDLRLGGDQRQNSLFLGGPVASEETRLFCGYREISTETNPNKLLPVRVESSLLPYHFYCGNQNGWGYWDEEERKARRWLDDGTEKMLPLYGVMDSTQSTLLEPPLDGDRLAGDMLIITRLPNPAPNSNGIHTIVGGMHGYSIEVFFKNLTQNLRTFNEVFRAHEYDYFQAIIPMRVERNHEVTIDWLGRGNWQPNIIKIDRAAYLASLSHRI